MNYKKYIIILIIFSTLILLSSSVSFATNTTDANTDKLVTGDVENININYLEQSKSVEPSTDIGQSTNSSNINSVTSVNNENTSKNKTLIKEQTNNANEGSFTELQTIITNCGTESVLNLDKNYSWNVNEANNISIINNNFTINGNGFTLNGNKNASIFIIKSNNILLTNIKFINAITAITIEGNNCAIINCSFTNNLADRGSAIISYNNRDLIIDNCNFENNTAKITGIIFQQDGTNIKITNNIFNNNTIKQVGGIAFIRSSNIYTSNNKFINNLAEVSVSTILISSSSNITIDNSEFIKNHANETSIIYLENAQKVNINNSIFDKNYAGHGIITSRDSEIKITNTDFTNNICQRRGVIETFNNSLIISESKFTNNTSNDTGSALSLQTTVVTIDNTIFKNNYAHFGGAIGIFETNARITNSIFESNKAKYDAGSAYIALSNYIQDNCIFINNTANKAGAIYIYKTDTTITNSIFNSNRANETAGAIYSNLNSLKLENNVFRTNNAPYRVDIYCSYNKTMSVKGNIWSVEEDNTTKPIINASKPIIIIGGYEYQNISEIPDKYDLRDYGFVTPVRNQGNGENCWAFAPIAALESCLLKAYNISYDFSECNMKNIESVYSEYGGGKRPNYPTDPYLAIGYLVNWFGPIFEEDDEYYYDNLLSQLFNSTMHTQDIVLLKPRTGPTDNNHIKEAIMKYGALSTIMYMNFSKYNTETYGYYESTEGNGNHCVTIVGWDDNYSASNFLETPEGDGAFIIRNSYGSKWGNGGYFYISYYDKRMMGGFNAQIYNAITYTFSFLNNETYNKIYHNDNQLTETFTIKNNECYYYNKYISESNDQISAFGAYILSEITNYTAKVYVNNQLKYTQSGVFDHIGYNTVPLNKKISLKEGDEFYVQLHIISPTDEIELPIAISSESNKVFSYNTSFYSEDGIIWEDIKDKVDGENSTLCLNVYTSEYRLPEDPSTIIECKNMTTYTVGSVDPKSGEYFNVTLKNTNGEVLANKTVQIIIKNKTYTKTTDKNGIARLQINLASAGNYVLTIKFLGDDYYQANTTTAKLKVVAQKLKVTVPNITYKSTVKTKTLTATLKTNKGTALPGIIVKFKINGKTYSAKTNSKGLAKVNISLNKKKTYAFTVSYSGSNKYAAITKTAKLIIK